MKKEENPTISQVLNVPKITSYLSIALPCSCYMKSLGISASFKYKYIDQRKSSSDLWLYNNKTLICFSQWIRYSKGHWADTHSSPHNGNLAPLSLFILISMEVECSEVACVPRYNHTDPFYMNESEEDNRCIVVSMYLYLVFLIGWLSLFITNSGWNFIIKLKCIGNVC